MSATPFSERDYKHIDDDFLWETPRASVEKDGPRDFKDGDDVKVVFTDGSWCRLHTSSRDRLMRYLVDRLDFSGGSRAVGYPHVGPTR